VILIGLDRPGLEIITRLRKALPDVGIIALAMLESNAYRQAAPAAGADDVVRTAGLTTDLLLATRRVFQANRSLRRHRSSRRRVDESERLTADPYPRERSWWAAGWFAFPKKEGSCYRACFEVRTGRR
jgi:DNA-binding NarL/FixJ family response regulator